MLKITLSPSDRTGRVGELSLAKPPLTDGYSEGADIDKQADRNQCPSSHSAIQSDSKTNTTLWRETLAQGEKERDKHLKNIHQSAEHLLLWPALRVGVRRKGFILERHPFGSLISMNKICEISFCTGKYRSVWNMIMKDAFSIVSVKCCSKTQRCVLVAPEGHQIHSCLLCRTTIWTITRLHCLVRQETYCLWFYEKWVEAKWNRSLVSPLGQLKWRYIL